MLILAIESSGEICGIALVQDGELVSLRQRRHRMDLLSGLTAEIDEALRAHSIKVSDLGGIAVSLGPGSFTGLRIGIATAKTLAYALGKPIVGIPTLDVLARDAARVRAEPGLIAAVTSSRPDEFYAAIYRARDGDVERLTDYVSVAKAEIGSIYPVASQRVFVCGPGAPSAMEGFWASGAEPVLCGAPLSSPNPWTLAILGEERLSRGESDDPVALVPLYVRRPTPEVRLDLRLKPQASNEAG